MNSYGISKCCYFYTTHKPYMQIQPHHVIAARGKANDSSVFVPTCFVRALCTLRVDMIALNLFGNPLTFGKMQKAMALADLT